jgi:hypothetical protein
MFFAKTMEQAFCTLALSNLCFHARGVDMRYGARQAAVHLSMIWI